MNFSEMQAALEAAGVVGAGGAGFPTHRKMARGIDTVLVNAVECEPLLHTDACLLRHCMRDVLSGAEAFARAMGAADVLLCVKEHNAGPLGLADGQSLSQLSRVRALPNVYPMGDEIVLIYEALGRQVPAGQLPSAVGVVVINAETALNIHGALQGQPVTEKWLTLGGAVEAPCVVRVPVGTPVAALLEARGITVPPGHALLDGGPAMGKLIDPATALVTKTTKGLLVLPESCTAVRQKRADPRRMIKRTPSACCQCTRCTDLCPRRLLGWPLQPHKTLRSAGMRQVGQLAGVTSALLCSGCGVCSFVACCQGCDPATVMQAVKGSLAAEGLRWQGGTKKPDPLREYRLVPARRFAALLGVRRFERPADWDRDFIMEPVNARG